MPPTVEVHEDDSNFFTIMYLTKPVTANQNNSSSNKNSRRKTRGTIPDLAQMLNLDTTTEHGRWAQELVTIGTPSMGSNSIIFSRMMAATGRTTVDEVSSDDVVRFLWETRRTCKPQSLDTYCGAIRVTAERHQLDWANDILWPLLRRGLKRTATERHHAKPLEVEDFQRLCQCLPPDAILALLVATLSGERLDETFRLTKGMISFVTRSGLSPHLRRITPTSHQFVAFSTRMESKMGPTDPESLRFVDILLLSQVEVNHLKTMMSSTSEGTTIFKNRSILTVALQNLGYGDHSCKGGCALLLSRLIRDEHLPPQILPQMLKHKANSEICPSVTAGYLGCEGKLNLLQVNKTFEAAFWLRRVLCNDV